MGERGNHFTSLVRVSPRVNLQKQKKPKGSEMSPRPVAIDESGYGEKAPARGSDVSTDRQM